MGRVASHAWSRIRFVLVGCKVTKFPCGALLSFDFVRVAPGTAHELQNGRVPCGLLPAPRKFSANPKARYDWLRMARTQMQLPAFLQCCKTPSGSTSRTTMKNLEGSGFCLLGGVCRVRILKTHGTGHVRGDAVSVLTAEQKQKHNRPLFARVKAARCGAVTSWLS